MAYAEGCYVKGRTARQAIKTRIPIGRQMLFEEWVAFEFQVLGQLHRAPLSVPKPLAFAGCSKSMEYIGDREASAPHLRNVILPQTECRQVLFELLATIEDMLSIKLTHGDLSDRGMGRDPRRSGGWAGSGVGPLAKLVVW